MSSTKRFVMASPSPVPPWRRAIDASPCSNEPNILSKYSGSMPHPVSSTANRSHSRPSSPSSNRSMSSVTRPPSGVNLNALPMRLYTTWFNRKGSPTTLSGTLPSTTVSKATPRSAAWVRNTAASEPMNVARSNASYLISILPLSILLMSSMSLISDSRCSEDSVTFSKHSRTLASSPILSSAMAVMPMMPFMGVRISCDMRDRKSVLARLACCASAKARSARSFSSARRRVLFLARR